MHLFKVLSLDTKCIVPFTKRILHYKNILVSTLFEHVQYVQCIVLIIVAKSKGLTSEIKLLLTINHSKL